MELIKCLAAIEHEERSQEAIREFFYGKGVGPDGRPLALNMVVAVPGVGGGGLPGLSRVGTPTAGSGFLTFARAKTGLGSPGKGNVYDHVVERSQIGRSGFNPTQIHSAENLRAVPTRVNQLKADFYSSKQPFTNNVTVRDWLTGKPFNEQLEFGLKVLRQIQGSLGLD